MGPGHQRGMAEGGDAVALGVGGGEPRPLQAVGRLAQVVLGLGQEVLHVGPPPEGVTQFVQVCVDQVVSGHGTPFNTAAIPAENDCHAWCSRPSAFRPPVVRR